MDLCALAVAAAACGGAAVLWLTVLDPSRPRDATERAWSEAARALGLRYRARREPLGPRLIGSRRGVELDVELERGEGKGARARASCGPVAEETVLPPLPVGLDEQQRWVRRLAPAPTAELEAAVATLCALAQGGTLAIQAGVLELCLPAAPTAAEPMVALLDALTTLALARSGER